MTREQKITSPYGEGFGYEVVMSGNTAVVDNAYIFVHDGDGWKLQQVVFQSVEDELDSCAISGDTLIVGAGINSYPYGAAYVYVRNGESWTLQQRLLASDPSPPRDTDCDEDGKCYRGDGFGTSVAISGNTAIVGASEGNSHRAAGAAYVFTRQGSSWTEQQILTLPDQFFGHSVAIDGDTAVVAGESGTQAYAAIYERNGNWGAPQRFPVQNAGSVAISGDTIIVGTTSAEKAHLFSHDGSTWTRGQELSGHSARTVAISGRIVVVGGQGAAFVYAHDPGTGWTLRQTLVGDGGAESFGVGVAVSAGKILVAAGATDSELDDGGTVYAFRLSETGIKVNITTDEADADLEDNICDVDATKSGEQCSLRAAIETANKKPGPDRITFDIPGGGAQTISPGSRLPAITEKVSIDGRTQPGYVDKPAIQLFGTAVPGAEGLVFAAGSSGSTLSGVAINRFFTGVLLESDGNTVQKCFLGMDADGITIPSGSARQFYGIKITGKNNTIGAPRDNEAGIGDNHVYGNVGAGVWITGANATGNKVVGSNFGLPFGGDPNPEPERVSVHNILIEGGASNNTIGGTTREEINLILTAVTGISIREGANNNFVTRNLISQCETGVHIGGASANTIGGTISAGARNYIVDNEYGIQVGDDTTGGGQATTALNNKIYGNVLGLTEELVFSGNDYGIVVANAQNTMIGTGVFGEHNFIGNSVLDGIVLTQQAAETKVLGNFIGTDITGQQIAANHNGVFIAGSNNEVRNNNISGNNSDGVRVIAEAVGDPEPTGNLITDNRVGTNGTGTNAIPNGGNGISISGAKNSVTSNLISGNDRVGISVRGDNNALLNNKVGTDGTGMSAIPNVIGGIGISGTGNIVRSNQVSGNGGGIQLVPNQDNLAALAIGNSVDDNKVGVNADMTAALPNQNIGIGLRQASSNSITGNVVAGNKGSGIILQESSNNNVLRGNFIGVTPAGLAIPNEGHGIGITSDSSGNQIGGNTRDSQNSVSRHTRVQNPNSGQDASLSTDADRNTIAHNGGNGIHLSSTAGSGNIIGANSIFDNALGGIDLGGDGFTPNDPADADTGPNNLQNYPTIVGYISGGDLIVNYQVDSAPENSNYGTGGLYVEFFEADSSGEGRHLLGSDFYTANDYASGTPGTRQKNLGNAAALGFSVSDLLSATATDSDGNSSELTPPVTLTPTPASLQLLNISTRLNVQTGENVLIGGIIITGTEPKKVIVRAIGPSLGAAGVEGTLPDPILELFNGSGQPITTNDNWKDDQQAEIEASTIPPSEDAESAIVRTLAPGNYTAIVRGKNNTTGVGLVEVYDLGQEASSQIANISSRGFVESGENVMIGGFIVGGDTGVASRVVVRALGPSLGAAGVNGALPDPALQLIDANGFVVRANDNWKSVQQVEIEAIGLQPADDREAALVATVPAGSYTTIVRGADGGTGVGLVEVYNVK